MHVDPCIADKMSSNSSSMDSWPYKKKEINFINKLINCQATGRFNRCLSLRGWRPESRREVGRSKKTWRGTYAEERQQAGWNDWNTVRAVGRDRD